MQITDVDSKLQNYIYSLFSLNETMNLCKLNFVLACQQNDITSAYFLCNQMETQNPDYLRLIVQSVGNNNNDDDNVNNRA